MIRTASLIGSPNPIFNGMINSSVPISNEKLLKYVERFRLPGCHDIFPAKLLAVQIATKEAARRSIAEYVTVKQDTSYIIQGKLAASIIN